MSRQMYYDEEAGQLFPVPDVVEQKPVTNADRLRNMSDEELAEFLAEYRCVHKAPHCMESNCAQCWLNWLRQEVDG